MITYLQFMVDKGLSQRGRELWGITVKRIISGAIPANAGGNACAQEFAAHATGLSPRTRGISVPSTDPGWKWGISPRTRGNHRKLLPVFLD